MREVGNQVLLWRHKDIPQDPAWSAAKDFPIDDIWLGVGEKVRTRTVVFDQLG